MSEDFPKPKSLGGNVEVNFSDYTTKLDLKSNRYRYIGMWNLNFDLARLKLEIAKLENTPVDLSKLSDVVKMKLLKIKKLYMMN